jgi:protochlorophyllide reductase
VYLPTDPKPRFTDEGFEMSMGVNHLSHFLLLQLLLPELKKAKDPRVCVVGSVTGNKNTVAGSLVKPVSIAASGVEGEGTKGIVGVRGGRGERSTGPEGVRGGLGHGQQKHRGWISSQAGEGCRLRGAV